MFNLGHEEAKDLIRRAGNKLNLVVERGDMIVPSMNSAFPKQKPGEEEVDSKPKSYSQMVKIYIDLYLLTHMYECNHSAELHILNLFQISLIFDLVNTSPIYQSSKLIFGKLWIWVDLSTLILEKFQCFLEAFP